jgi:hypothetical protein
MTLEDIVLLSRRGRPAARGAGLRVGRRSGLGVRTLPAACPAAPIVLASGLVDGLSHKYAQRYIEILARSGVTVEERMTEGAGANLDLLRTRTPAWTSVSRREASRSPRKTTTS